jgi:hypothetical protein
LVVTVAHPLAGNGPMLVDGRPATLLALDTRADVALLATTDSTPESRPDPTPDPNGGWLRAPRAGERIQVATIDGTDVVTRPVDIARVAPIRFRDEVAGTVVERAGAVIPLTIRGGDSGAPLIGADGRVVAMLFAGSREANRSYAVSSTEIASLLDDLHGDRASAIRPDC